MDLQPVDRVLAGVVKQAMYIDPFGMYLMGSDQEHKVFRVTGMPHEPTFYIDIHCP